MLLALHQCGEGQVDGAADTDGQEGAAELEQRHTQRGGGVGSHEVEDGPHPVGHDGCDLVGRHHDMSAAGPAQFPCSVARVDRDHISRRHGTQDLHGEMAETAHTEHHYPVAGPQQRRGPLAGPVGGESGIGERAQLRQVGVGIDFQHRPFVGEQVLGVAAVDRDARSAAVGRMGVEAGAFRRTEPATDEGEADDRIAHRHRGDLGTDLVHPAGVLVAEHQRQRCSHLAGEQVQVGAAHAGCRNTHHDIERTDRTRCGHLVEEQRRGRQRSLHRVHSHCPHERHPPDLAPCGGARKS